MVSVLVGAAAVEGLGGFWEPHRQSPVLLQTYMSPLGLPDGALKASPKANWENSKCRYLPQPTCFCFGRPL